MRRTTITTGAGTTLTNVTDEYKQEDSLTTTSVGTTPTRKESQQELIYIGISVAGAAIIFIIILAAVVKNGWVNTRRGADINTQEMETTI